MTGPATASTLGEKLRSRREEVKMDRAALAGELAVPVDAVVAWEEDRGPVPTLEQLGEIAAKLDTAIGELTPDPVTDLDAGVRVQLPQDQTVLAGVRDNVDYYNYHCLVRTRTVPSMVPLVVEVLVDDPDRALFNSGHPAREFIYVLAGEVQLKWGDPEQPHAVVLPTGANAFIASGVPHTVTATKGSGPARLLSVNF